MRTFAASFAVVTHRAKTLGLASGLTFTGYVSTTNASFSGNLKNLGVFQSLLYV